MVLKKREVVIFWVAWL